MENVQNKEVKAGEGHVCEGHSGSCHCMLCSWKGGGWHGRHSLLRIAFGILVILGIFSFGVHVGRYGGHDRYDRGGYGHGGFERHMMGGAGFPGGQNIRYGGMMGGQTKNGQVFYHTVETTVAPRAGTTTMMGGMMGQ